MRKSWVGIEALRFSSFVSPLILSIRLGNVGVYLILVDTHPKRPGLGRGNEGEMVKLVANVDLLNSFMNVCLEY
jgi:hypothetical protein